MRETLRPSMGAALRRRRARGLTLLEVLIALVILSIGMLGLAGLQAGGMRVNQGSSYRFRASELAAELADLMRANRSTFATAAGTTCSGCSPSSPPTFTSAPLSDWVSNRLALLPGASCDFNVDGSGNATITIKWNDQRAAGSGTAVVSSTYMVTRL